MGSSSDHSAPKSPACRAELAPLPGGEGSYAVAIAADVATGPLEVGLAVQRGTASGGLTVGLSVAAPGLGALELDASIQPGGSTRITGARREDPALGPVPMALGREAALQRRVEQLESLLGMQRAATEAAEQGLAKALERIGELERALADTPRIGDPTAPTAPTAGAANDDGQSSARGRRALAALPSEVLDLRDSARPGPNAEEAPPQRAADWRRLLARAEQELDEAYGQVEDLQRELKLLRDDHQVLKRSFARSEVAAARMKKEAAAAGSRSEELESQLQAARARYEILAAGSADARTDSQPPRRPHEPE